MVEITYGEIGKSLSYSIKTQTTDLLEAKDSYVKIVKDKLSRGYNFPRMLATTLKTGI